MIVSQSGDFSRCEYPTDNPMPPPPPRAIQPPVDLDLDDLGCNLFGRSCESLLDCCAPHVCTGKNLSCFLHK